MLNIGRDNLKTMHTYGFGVLKPNAAAAITWHHSATCRRSRKKRDSPAFHTKAAFTTDLTPKKRVSGRAGIATRGTHGFPSKYCAETQAEWLEMTTEIRAIYSKFKRLRRQLSGRARIAAVAFRARISKCKWWRCSHAFQNVNGGNTVRLFKM
jgi:hypothetical protein